MALLYGDNNISFTGSKVQDSQGRGNGTGGTSGPQEPSAHESKNTKTATRQPTGGRSGIVNKHRSIDTLLYESVITLLRNYRYQCMLHSNGSIPATAAAPPAVRGDGQFPQMQREERKKSHTRMCSIQ